MTYDDYVQPDPIRSYKAKIVIEQEKTMPDIQQIDIKRLTLLERNPRTISKEGMAKLKKSLEKDPDFFNARPCLVHDTGDKLEVYAGNQRVRAAKALKWKQVPCIIEQGLSPDVVKERIIKDNKTYGQFDFEILANEFDVDLLLDAGFTTDTLLFPEIKNTDAISSEDLKEKKLKTCPSCGHEF